MTISSTKKNALIKYTKQIVFVFIFMLLIAFLIFIFGREKTSPLQKAAVEGNIQLVETLLAQGADVNAVSSWSNAPIHLAAYNGHIEVVKVLLQNGAEIESKGGHGKTPLHKAVFNGHTDIATFLINKGANIHVQGESGDSLLHDAAGTGNMEISKFLIEEGLDVNAIGYNGRTPLHDAASYGHLNTVKLLLENGADSSITENNGYSAFRVAEIGNHKAVMNFLNAMNLAKNSPYSGELSVKDTIQVTGALGAVLDNSWGKHGTNLIEEIDDTDIEFVDAEHKLAKRLPLSTAIPIITFKKEAGNLSREQVQKEIDSKLEVSETWLISDNTGKRYFVRITEVEVEKVDNRKFKIIPLALEDDGKKYRLRADYAIMRDILKD